MAFCIRCGKPVLPDQKFCAACGASLKEGEPQVTPPPAGPYAPPPTTTPPPKTGPIEWFKKRPAIFGAVGLVIVILLAVFVVYPLVSPSHDPALVLMNNVNEVWYGTKCTVHTSDVSWDGPNTLRVTSEQTWGSGDNATNVVLTQVVQKFSTTSEATAALSSKTAGLTPDPSASPYAYSPYAIATGDSHSSVYQSYYLPNPGFHSHSVEHWDNFIVDARLA